MSCPLNPCKVNRSRAAEENDQAIKDFSHGLRFLIRVANACMGDI